MQPPNPIVVILKKIWPTIYRIVNGFFYFILNFIKTVVRLAIEQVKGGF